MIKITATITLIGDTTPDDVLDELSTHFGTILEYDICSIDAYKADMTPAEEKLYGDDEE